MADHEQGEALRAHVQARHADIADHWYAAVARTSFSPHRATELRADLLALTDRVIAVLLSEPFTHDEARAVGAALPGLHYVSPEALDRTIEMLGRELVAGLPTEQAAALQPRLAALLGSMAAGFYARSRVLILEEQDQIRRALFVTRQQAEVVEEARARAEAAVRIRTDVLHAAAHDLRSPVTAILGHADLLRVRLSRDTQPSPEWLRTQAASIRANAMRISAMVEELLDVARLQAGQALELHLEPVDVGRLVRGVAQLHETSASGATPILVEAPEGIVVEGDRPRLERVVENLLGNAIKYGQAGAPVYLDVRREGIGACIAVRDQGVGIPADELPRLFTPFFRASTARGIAGIGIGLSGVKTIVEQHGGHIAVESAPGQGTTVTITLPIATSSLAAAHEGTSQGQVG